MEEEKSYIVVNEEVVIMPLAEYLRRSAVEKKRMEVGEIEEEKMVDSGGNIILPYEKICRMIRSKRDVLERENKKLEIENRKLKREINFLRNY